MSKKDNEKMKGENFVIKGVVCNPVEDSNSHYEELGFDSIYFGHCLYPNHDNFLTHAFGDWGVENFFFCPLCRIKWSVGQGIFSLPKKEMLDCSIKEYIMENTKMLDDYDDFTDKQITWEEYLKLKKDVEEMKKS